jgi:multiple sugar transport system permease protein
VSLVESSGVPITARTLRTRRDRRRAERAIETSRSLVSDADLHRARTRAVYYAVLALIAIGFALVFVFPLYWMVSSAFKAPAELVRPHPTIVPHTFHPHAYSDAWTTLRLPHYLFNTAYYAVGGWLIQLLVDTALAYALSRLRPVGGKIVLGLVLATLLLPGTALLIPLYVTVVNVPVLHLHLLNSPWALWLPGAANAFNVYVLKRFFDQIPGELLDAASIDGAGRLRVLWNIVLPLSRPVLAVVSIISIIGIWKDFLWPLMVLQDPNAQTVNVALQNLQATSHVPENVFYAGLVIASAPMIVFFLLFQRHILSGLQAGALKG